MEIHAKVTLSLPSKFYKIILKYDTFEKATYDSYLVASIIANTKSKTSAIKYIDEITGKGSLNNHFKKLYTEISQLTSEQINSILNDSLFPVTVIDTKNHFKYYPMFNATRMNNNVYDGNLENAENLRDLIMPKDKNIKFLSLDFEIEDSIVKQDSYNAIFSNKEIKVDLDGGNYYPISTKNFNEVYKNDIEEKDISLYQGTIGTTISEGNWVVLNNAILNVLHSTKLKYLDSEGNYCCIYPEKIKKVEIIKVFSLYFYKETSYDFSQSNAKICQEAIEYLLESKNINEIKTKSIVSLLEVINEKTSQKVISYILTRKDSKEIAESGLSLIKKGLEKGWDEQTLEAIKKQAKPEEINYIYKLAPSLKYDITEIINIDDNLLSKKDLKGKKEYLNKKENMIQQINLMIGEITTSGIREKIKKLPEKNANHKEFIKFMNKYIGHSKKEYESLPIENLTKEYEYIKEMYSYYLKIKDRVDNN